MNKLSIQRLKDERKNKGKTQKDVADFLGLTKQAVQRYEAGLSTPKLKTWEKLADFFEVDIAFLQGFTDIRNANAVNTKVPVPELQKIIDELGTEQFNKSVHQQIAKDNSDRLSPVLEAMEGPSTSDSYDQNISNIPTRNLLYNSFWDLAYIARLSQNDDRVLAKIYNFITAVEASLVDSADNRNKEQAERARLNLEQILNLEIPDINKENRKT